MKTFALLAVTTLALTGCVASDLPADDPVRLALVEQECTLYRAAAADMMSKGQRVGAGVLEGCAQGGAVANIATTTTRQAQTRFPELIYRRMLARGVSNDTAMAISKSAAYWALSDAYVAAYGA